MPAYNTVAIIIRRLNYGETDKILTLYSRDRGRISAIAKGARKAISRMSGSTELLTCTRFQLATGKSLEIVTQTEIKESFTDLRQDIQRLAHGLYFADLIDHVVADDDPNPILYDLLLSGLYILQRVTPPELGARWFDIQLLQDLGYAPDLANCAVCREFLPGHFAHDEEFALSASLGGAICPRHAHPARNPDHSAIDYEALTLMQTLQRFGPDNGHLTAQLPTPTGRALNQSRLALRRYLRFRIERELKSLEFLDSLGYVA